MGTISSKITTLAPITFTNLVRKEVDVIILAGQSNALGFPNETNGFGTTGTSLPVELQSNQVHRSWNTTSTSPNNDWIDQPLHPQSPEYWGVEITGLNSIYTNYHRLLVLVKVAKGSTGLYDTNRWQKGGTCYVQLTNSMLSAKARLQAEGYTVNWRQLWWIQGENDATAESNAVAYATNFNRFWIDLCADTGLATNTSIVLAPLADHYGNSFAAAVRSNQTVLGAQNNIDLVVTDDLPFYSGVHYSAESLMTLGGRFAAKYMEHFGATPYPSALTNATIVEKME